MPGKLKLWHCGIVRHCGIGGIRGIIVTQGKAMREKRYRVRQAQGHRGETLKEVFHALFS